MCSIVLQRSRKPKVHATFKMDRGRGTLQIGRFQCTFYNENHFFNNNITSDCLKLIGVLLFGIIACNGNIFHYFNPILRSLGCRNPLYGDVYGVILGNVYPTRWYYYMQLLITYYGAWIYSY